MESVLSKELPKRYYIYGETGTGKSLFTRVISAKLKSPMYKKSASGYWNGYKGEKIVVIEDLDRESWEYIKYNLKKWADYDTFLSAPLRNKDTKEEIKAGEMIDPREYTLIVTSYKPLNEFLERERDRGGAGEEKMINERDISKIERLFEVYEMKHTKLEEIKTDIEQILN